MGYLHNLHITIPIAQAGFREKTYLQDRLVTLGVSFKTKDALSRARYNPYTDIIFYDNYRFKVKT